MLALALATTLAASPSVGLMISVELGKPDPGSSALTWLDALEAELTAAKLPVVRLTSTCQGDRACELKLGAEAKVGAVVPVTLSWAKKKVSIDVEAVRLSDGASVAQVTFTATGRLSKPQQEQLMGFANRISAALPSVSDVPKVEPKVEAPPPPKEDPVKVALAPAPAPAASGSKVPALVVGGVALAAGVASGVMLGVASAGRADFDAKTMDPSPLTRAEAVQMKDTVNGQYSASLGLGIGAAAAAVVAAVLFAVN